MDSHRQRPFPVNGVFGGSRPLGLPLVSFGKSLNSVFAGGGIAYPHIERSELETQTGGPRPVLGDSPDVKVEPVLRIPPIWFGAPPIRPGARDLDHGRFFG